MYDYLANVKLYTKLRKEIGIIGSEEVHIGPNKIKRLSQFFSVKVKLNYLKNSDYHYFYTVHIDGITFGAVSDLKEIKELGLTEKDFKREAEVWG